MVNAYHFLRKFLQDFFCSSIHIGYCHSVKYVRICFNINKPYTILKLSQGIHHTALLGGIFLSTGRLVVLSSVIQRIGKQIPEPLCRIILLRQTLRRSLVHPKIQQHLKYRLRRLTFDRRAYLVDKFRSLWYDIFCR